MISLRGHHLRCRAPRALLAALAAVHLLGSGFAGVGLAALQNALILNEYNAVDSAKYLDKDTYKESPTKGDAYFKTISGIYGDYGRIEGAGGNWVELVVTQDHLNIQGWSLRWVSTDRTKADAANGTAGWYGAGTYEQGMVTFSSTAAVWSDLRAGTILTLSEKPLILVDPQDNGNGNYNFTKSPPHTPTVPIDLSTNTSFDPAADDWWINVSTRQEQESSDPLVTTVTNVTGDGPGYFSVGPYDWQMEIWDNAGNRISGPVGEKVAGWGGGSINSNAAGKLQANPSSGTTLASYDNSTNTTFGMPNTWTPGGVPATQDFSELRSVVVPEPATWMLLVAGAVALLPLWRRRGMA